MREIYPDSFRFDETNWRFDDQVLCFKCGKMFKHVGIHVSAFHGITAAEYREAWGLAKKQPLSSRDISDKRRVIAIETGGVERLTALALEHSGAARPARSGTFHGDAGRHAISKATKERRAAARETALLRGQENAQAAGHTDIRSWIIALRDSGERRETLREVTGIPESILVELCGQEPAISWPRPGPSRLIPRQADVDRLRAMLDLVPPFGKIGVNTKTSEFRSFLDACKDLESQGFGVNDLSAALGLKRQKIRYWINQSEA